MIRSSVRPPERVAIFSDTYTPDMNGVARTLARLEKALTDRGAEVRVFAPRTPAARGGDGVRRFGSVPFWAYPELRLSWPARSRVRRELLSWKPTLIHAATPFGLGLAARATAKRLGIPFVTSYHTSLSEYARFYKLGAISEPGWSFLRWFHNSGRRTFVPTRAIGADLDSRGFTNVSIWSRGVDTTRFNPGWRSAALREQLGVGDGDVLAIYVGRVAKEKGIGVLLDAAHVVHRAMPNVRIAIVGDGPYDREARMQAPPSVKFLGRLSGNELSAFYASGDLFLFPSTTDTFGNVILEAMASGLPVIGADVGPTRELLESGGGVTFAPGSAIELAATLGRLVADRAYRSTLASAGLARAQRASWDAIFDDLFIDYRNAITHPDLQPVSP